MTQARLSPDAVQWAIKHVAKHGDTDIFVHPFELRFFRDMADEISDYLSRVPISEFRPLGALESLVPKSRYGFRVAHQLYPLDTIILTAATLEVGNDFEKARCSRGVSYSYRFDPNEEFDLFSDNCRYRDWLMHQWANLAFSDDCKEVVEADISDFYQRISHHRLDNCLNGATKKRANTNLIRTYLKDIRSRQSFGIPVGNNASRLLAEILLTDTDKALLAEGYEFTRYVDDYRFFLKSGQEPYALLAFLAEQLMTNEGLSLNPAKTLIHSSEDYQGKLRGMSGEDLEQADESATEHLFYLFYDSEEEKGDEALEHLRSKDLIAELEEELSKPFWNHQVIRVLLRALKITSSPNAGKFVADNMRTLLPFVKDVVLLMEELKEEGVADFDDLADEVVKIIFEPAAQHLPVVRSWLLELFVRKVIKISPSQLRLLRTLQFPLDQRAILYLRGLLNEVTFFRSWKGRIHELNAWEQPAFILAARCLPQDEYETWIGNIRKLQLFPLQEIFCKWVLTKQRD